MKKLIALVVISLAALNISPAQAAAPTPTNVGAYFKVEAGYMVNWSIPANTSGITGYTVTSSGGQSCKVSGPNQNQCTFPISGFKPYVGYTFTVVANSKSGDSVSSAPSNVATWFSAPGYPAPVLTKVISDTQIDVEWVPNTFTGGISNYGYKVIRWEVTLNAYGMSLLFSSATLWVVQRQIGLTLPQLQKLAQRLLGALPTQLTAEAHQQHVGMQY
jgi:hypothetical protein